MSGLFPCPGQIGGRTAVLAVMIVVLAALAPVPASALQTAPPLGALGGTGGCVRDVLAPDLGGCARTAAGLQGAGSIALVDGGRHVAVAAPGSDAVSFLRRTPGAGTLARGFCITPPGEAACPVHAGGLHGADALAATAGMLDVGSIDDRAVVVLRGGSVAGCVSAGPVAGCALRDAALGHVAALAVSPDGHTAYAASYGSDPGADTIVALAQRAPTTARAGRPVVVLQPVGGSGGCAQSLGGSRAHCPRTTGLQGVVGVAVSGDGRSLYAASAVSSAIVGFARNPGTGAITPAGCIGDATRVGSGDTPCPLRIAGMRGADAVALSPDGRFVYVASQDPGAVVAFARDTTTGALRPLGGVGGCLSAYALPGCATVPSLRGARALAFAPGGGELDVAAPGADAVVPLRRDATGGLTAPPSLSPAAAPILNGVGALAPFGRQLYGASAVDDGVVVLER